MLYSLLNPIIDDSSYEDLVYKYMYKLVCLLYAVVSNLSLTIPRMRKYNEKKSSLYISQYIQAELVAISTPDNLLFFKNQVPERFDYHLLIIRYKQKASHKLHPAHF